MTPLAFNSRMAGALMAAGEELVALADGFVSRRSGGLICCAVAARAG